MRQWKLNKPIDPNVDLLTLKKMVVDEIKSDLENNKIQGKYSDPFKRRDNIESGTDNIELVGGRKPESEEVKIRNLERQRQRKEMEGKVADENAAALLGNQEVIVDQLTDLILEEYLKHENQMKQQENLTEEEKEYLRQRERVNGFVAGLNLSQSYSHDSMDPTVKDIGEEVLKDKIDSIFNALQKDKKKEEISMKSIERKRTINELMKTSTANFDKGKRKIEFDLEQSWEEGGEEVKGKSKVNRGRSKDNKGNKGNKSRESTIIEVSEESSPVKSRMSDPVGSGMHYVGAEHVMVSAGPAPVSGPSSQYYQNLGYQQVSGQPMYQPVSSQPMQSHPGFNLSDIQHIVSQTIANEMK